MPRSFRVQWKLPTVLASVLLGGCASLGANHDAPLPQRPPAIDRAATQAALLASYLEVLQRVVQGPPAEQAEILSGARHDFETAPTPSHELRYAMVLATPGHPGTNCAKAQQLLRELIATQETLLPTERAMAFLTLKNVDLTLSQAAENQRLQVPVDHSDRDRVAALTRRLQGEIDDNARLHKELDDAHAKLDAIANIERALNKPKVPGGTP
ncbi:MAG TPA: hypothetical protein VHW25_15325 [Steroidobacteraceae bacterium]|jgi:hypothetical protein|nr:hypothetical protein [Steroidobacteraceae bacterium]